MTSNSGVGAAVRGWRAGGGEIRAVVRGDMFAERKLIYCVFGRGWSGKEGLWDVCLWDGVIACPLHVYKSRAIALVRLMGMEMGRGLQSLVLGLRWHGYRSTRRAKWSAQPSAEDVGVRR